jgi:hypothetical protein
MSRGKSWSKDSMIKAVEGIRKEKGAGFTLDINTFSDPHITLKDDVKKHEKSARDQVEMPLRNQLLQVTRKRRDFTSSESSREEEKCSYVSTDDNSDEDAECSYRNGKFSEDKKKN